MLDEEPRDEEEDDDEDEHRIAKVLIVHGDHGEQGDEQRHLVLVEGTLLVREALVGEEARLQLEAPHEGEGQPEEGVEPVSQRAVTVVPAGGLVPAEVPFA